MTDLVTNTNLIWAAKEVFKFPEYDHMQTVQELLEWGISGGYIKSGELIDQVERELENLDVLKVDFTNLFVNSYPSAKAHPFAGWYLGEEIIFGDSAGALEKMYADFGVLYEREEAKLPADHILVELEFLAVMAEEYEQTGDEFYLDALLKMINEHMQDWIYELLDNVESNADTAYFKALAITIRAFFLHLQQELKGVA